MRVVYRPKDHGACGYYRCRLPGERLEEHGLAEVMVCDGRYTQEDMTYQSASSDVHVFQYPSTPTSFNYIMWAAEHLPEQKIVVEMDDNPYAISPFNEMGYPDFGLHEVEYTFPGQDKPVKLWQDGRNGLDIKRNEERIAMFTDCLRKAALVTTTVEPLAKVFGEVSKNVLAFPNCLDFRIWKPYRPPRTDDTVRIAWHGGASHYEDWHMIHEAVRRVMERNEKTRLLIFGSTWESMFRDYPEGRLDYAEWCDIHMFPYVLAWLPIDIGICPLKETEFSVCKSPLKWEELAALSLPAVASNTPPYSNAIEHGKTGMLADDPQAFEEHLEELVRNPEKRREIGLNAMCAVRAGYDIDVRIKDLWEAYKAIMET